MKKSFLPFLIVLILVSGCASVEGASPSSTTTRVHSTATTLSLTLTSTAEPTKTYTPSPTPFPLCEVSEKHACTVLISVSDGFEYTEYSMPSRYLKQSGYKIVIAGPSLDQITASDGNTTVKPRTVLTEADPSEFDAILFIGAIDFVFYYHNSDEVQELVQRAFEQNTIIAGICDGVRVLNESGILKGKNATIIEPSTMCSTIEARGAICSYKNVVRDGNVITAQGPPTSKEFGIVLVEALLER